jgi:hypothetical protein
MMVSRGFKFGCPACFHPETLEALELRDTDIAPQGEQRAPSSPQLARALSPWQGAGHRQSWEFKALSMLGATWIFVSFPPILQKNAVLST